MTEIWKDVVGYEGIYQVSDRGRVIRVGGGVQGATPGRILKPVRARGGYLQVCLCRHGKGRRVYVHRLVAEAFLGPAPSPKHQVNHKNGDKADNRIQNLEWVTASQNRQHACRVLGQKLTAARARGEAHGQSRLTERKVRQIRRLYATDKKTQQELAEMFGVNQSAISKIVRRETWQHVSQREEIACIRSGSFRPSWSFGA